MRRDWWPGLVWAVPLAAAMIVGYLGLRAYAQRGVDVMVTFDTGAGVRAGATQVFYKGVSAGRVTKVELNRDGRRFDMTLRLDPRAKPVLVTGTVFTFIGAKPSLTDISSIRAALSGVSIGLYPSDHGAPTRRFVGLDEPPIVPPRSAGRSVFLSAKEPGAIQRGSDVTYHGVVVGKVMEVHLVGLQSIATELFVSAPYDRLLRRDSVFWKSSPLQVSLSGQGIGASFKPAAALTGEVAFDTPDSAGAEPEAPAGSRYTLFASQAEADSALSGPEVLYQAVFDGPTGDLKVGAPVTLRGFPIGMIQEVGFGFDEASGAVSTPVTLAVAPAKLHLVSAVAQPAGYWRERTDAALNRLAARGWRLRLRQSPPLLGPRAIDIEPDRGPPARVDYGGVYPRLPTSGSGDLSSTIATAGEVLAKVNALPIEDIGQSLKRTADRLDGLIGSPEVADSLHHLDSSLVELDQLVHAVRPQAGELVVKLNAAADQLQQTAASANRVLSGQGAGQDESLPGAIRELTDAARSVRALSDYLGRHPEAVIRGKAKAP